MKKTVKLYLDAQEISELLGISMCSAYRIIRNMNNELSEDGFMVIAGKVPRKYFEVKWYGGCGV